MMGLRQQRLARENELRADGSEQGPVSGSASGDAARELPVITWGDLTVTDATPDTTPGTKYDFAGFGLAILTGGSDSNTLVSLCWQGQSNYVHLQPGQLVVAPEKARWFYLKRSATLPANGNQFRIAIFPTRGAYLRGYFSPTGARTGAALFTPTVTAGTGAAGIVCPARAGRWKAIVSVDGGGDAYIADTALGATAALGFLVASGGSLTLEVTGDIYGNAPAGTNIRVMEVYSS